ncbi:uncharacterized protein F4807DRAFT_468902 [Annulohypoxylon truncatum]|uniref:uncharacterized protein n=1 Tax=Annulohypoxylon truncatum TaxID=327061 RepID=UPI002007A620|nr:uncharacterized protein F4807DRAFT_468902 [Annulohypoxylon truncatum]KAI1208015.1 hypothetical protein F4807DRAFT_468902 [Annulohypoxylon truncatum]
MSRKINCGKSHGHFGQYGAAGLLIHRYRDTGEVEILLCRRARHTDDEGLWGTIGGAIIPGETVHECALREVEEEIGIKAGDICIPTAQTTDDHGTWKYTTIFATPAEGLQIPDLTLNRAELSEVSWISRQELQNYILHPAFENWIYDLLDILLPPDIDPQTRSIVRPSKLKKR